MSHSTNLLLLFVFPLVSSCQTSYSVRPELSLESVFELDVHEPSGLSPYLDHSLITVSDRNGKAYVLDTLGHISSTIDLNGEDLEGVSFNPLDSLIYAVDESDATLRSFSIRGEKVDSWQIFKKGGDSSLEGCSVDSKHQTIYLLKEKSHGLLIRLDLTTGKQSEHRLTFAEDYSGVYYDAVLDKLWIVSHESKSVNLCALNGQLERSFGIDVKQAEGIFVNHGLSSIYVISDSQEKLFKFRLPEL